MSEGVGGMASRTFCGNAFVFAVVVIVKPRLFGLRFGGEGGLVNDWADAPFLDALSNANLSRAVVTGRDVIDAARPP